MFVAVTRSLLVVGSSRLVTGVREGRLELPRPFGHRILRLLRLRTDPGSTGRPVSSGVDLRPRVWPCREQSVSKKRPAVCAMLRRTSPPSMRGIDVGEQADALLERVFGSVVGSAELMTIYIGDRLGLYEALAEGWLTPSALASRASIAERYAREWLEQQAVAGFLEVDDIGAAAGDRK